MPLPGTLPAVPPAPAPRVKQYPPRTSQGAEDRSSPPCSDLGRVPQQLSAFQSLWSRHPPSSLLTSTAKPQSPSPCLRKCPPCEPWRKTPAPPQKLIAMI